MLKRIFSFQNLIFLAFVVCCIALASLNMGVSKINNKEFSFKELNVSISSAVDKQSLFDEFEVSSEQELIDKVKTNIKSDYKLPVLIVSFRDSQVAIMQEKDFNDSGKMEQSYKCTLSEYVLFNYSQEGNNIIITKLNGENQDVYNHINVKGNTLKFNVNNIDSRFVIQITCEVRDVKILEQSLSYDPAYKFYTDSVGVKFKGNTPYFSGTVKTETVPTEYYSKYFGASFTYYSRDTASDYINDFVQCIKNNDNLLGEQIKIKQDGTVNICGYEFLYFKTNSCQLVTKEGKSINATLNWGLEFTTLNFDVEVLINDVSYFLNIHLNFENID